MHIKSATIRNFKRFEDLVIENIPSTAQIVLLAGPNGSGKSSLFDAFLTWFRLNAFGQGSGDASYYNRSGEKPPEAAPHQRVSIEFYEQVPVDQPLKRAMFYFRSAYRNDPDFNVTSVSRVGEVLDENRFGRMIDPDTAVRSNYMRLASRTLEETLVTEDGSLTLAEYRERLVGGIRQSMNRLFPDLTFSDLGNPINNGTFRFNKGTTSGFEYKNLSGGEKATFDILLDLTMKKDDYSDAIFCIDEPEAHLNAQIQAELLAELRPSVSALRETTLPDLINEGVKGFTHAIPAPDSGPQGAR